LVRFIKSASAVVLIGVPACSFSTRRQEFFFALGAMAFETRIVHWTPDFPFALCWLVIVLSFGAIWLLYFLISRAAATRVVILFYLTPPVTAFNGMGTFQ
jgi:drug/metabolite transporter (DMT)-like permease